MRRLQNKGELGKDYSLARFKALLAENCLDMSAPADVIKNCVERSQAAEEANKAEKAISEAVNVEQEKRADTPKPTDEPPVPHEEPAPESEAPKVKELPIKKRDRKAYAIAIRAGEATPGNIRKWLKDKEAAEGTQTPSTESVQHRHIIQATAARQAKSDDLTRSDNLKLGTYGKTNKKWKQLRDKSAMRTTYDQDGNPETVEVDMEDADPPPEPEHEEVPDPDAWRSKIYLSAVECEQKHVHLPTPDFPFKQNQLNQVETTMNPGKKRKRKKQNQESQAHDNYEGYQDYQEPEKIKQPEKAKVPTQHEASLSEDLPMLPNEISTLPDLSLPLLRGSVIAFKQLGMDERYNPIIVDYRTALVEKVFTDVSNGPRIELRLAIRDRPEVYYDEETGERVLGKFDMPGFDRDEESGFMDAMWGELLEPKLVKLPEGGFEAEEIGRAHV